jgi:hypothetical protein
MLLIIIIVFLLIIIDDVIIVISLFLYYYHSFSTHSILLLSIYSNYELIIIISHFNKLSIHSILLNHHMILITSSIAMSITTIYYIAIVYQMSIFITFILYASLNSYSYSLLILMISIIQMLTSLF